jgi:hypothetical protein
MTALARAKLIDALLLNPLIGLVVEVFVSITFSPPYFVPHLLGSQVKIKKRLPAVWRVLPVLPSMISIVGITDSGSKSVADVVTTILART